MVFNYEINITTGIALLTAAGVIYGFFFNTRNNQEKMSDSLKALKDLLGAGMSKLDNNIDKMNKVVMDMALGTQRQDNFEKRTDDRFKMIQDDLREMKHGKGFVND
jgi:hypothetical protein